MLAIGDAEVRSLLTMPACIDLMADALAALAAGQAQVPLRSLMWLPDRSGLLGMMPGHLATAGVMGIKVVSVMPGNHGTPFDAHQGVVLIFETRHGRPLALVDATSITAIRTAAVSGVATRLLARPDAGDLAILGSGTQAVSHLEAMCAVRPIRRVRVWSRTPSHARQFAETESGRRGIPIEIAADAREAVAGADLVCTTTASPEPVLHGAWISPGTHINAVGSSVRSARELDSAAVARSRLFVDRRESTLNEAGDFLMARAEGAITDDHIIAEIGDILDGRAQGRRTAAEITLFKSLGLSVEDVASAMFVYQQASAQGAGTRLAASGLRTAHSTDG
jgi:ornithine cyclodeaminase